MKNIILTVGLLFFANAYATIEYSADQESQATPQEISKNRACFQELEVQGCGDPGEDPKHFRSCLKNVRETLTTDCRKMMKTLYGI